MTDRLTLQKVLKGKGYDIDIIEKGLKTYIIPKRGHLEKTDRINILEEAFKVYPVCKHLFIDVIIKKDINLSAM